MADHQKQARLRIRSKLCVPHFARYSYFGMRSYFLHRFLATYTRVRTWGGWTRYYPCKR
jgi:hypothetical protein